MWITWKINEHYFLCFPGFQICCIHFFCISSFFWTPGWNWQKNWAKAKQHPEAELLLFENYLLSSSMLSSRNNRAYSKECAKKKVCLFVYFNEIIWLIIRKVKTKNRWHKYDINRPTSRHGVTYTNKHKSASVWWCLYALSNTQPTLEVQFIKKLRSTEAKLKKMCSL